MFTQQKYLPLLYILVLIIFVLVSVWLLVKLFPFYKKLIMFFLQILTPFIIAALLAYLIYPLVQWLNKFQIPKAFAVILIFSLFLGITLGLIYRAYPAIMFQLNELNEQLPDLMIMYEAMIRTIYDSTAFFPDGINEQIDQFILRLEAHVEQIIGKWLERSIKIFDFFIVVSVIPVLIFYYLKDYENISQSLLQLIPVKHRTYVKKMITSLDHTLGQYIRAQIIISSFVSLATFLMFHLLGVPYALLLAIIIGLTNIIPYFGPLIGSVPAGLVALTESYQMLIFVIVAIVIIQVIEGNFLSPYVLGKSIKIHPIIIILVLLIGGKLSGIIGMVLAVPTLVIIKALFSHTLVMGNEH